MMEPSSLQDAHMEMQSTLIMHLKDLSIMGTIVCGGMTFTRLYIRRGRLWWDDWIGTASLIFMVFSTVTVNLHLQYETWLSHPQSTRVALYYLFSMGFYITMWLFRISVLLAFIRLDLYARFLYPTIAIYGLACLILCLQLVWTCEKMLDWQTMRMPSCSVGRTAACIQIVCSVLADSVLLFTPLIALWRSSVIPNAHRIRLAVVFGSNIFVTAVCMVHSAYTLLQPGLNLVLVTVLQLTVALIVCNLPVNSAALHRIYTKYQQSKERNQPSLATMVFRLPHEVPRHGTYTDTTGNQSRPVSTRSMPESLMTISIPSCENGFIDVDEVLSELRMPSPTLDKRPHTKETSV